MLLYNSATMTNWVSKASGSRKIELLGSINKVFQVSSQLLLQIIPKEYKCLNIFCRRQSTTYYFR